MDRVFLYPGDLHNVGDLALLFQAHYGLKRSNLADAQFAVVLWNAMVDPLIKKQLNEAGISIISGKNLVRRFRQVPRSLHVMSGGQLVRNNSSAVNLIVLALLLFAGRWMGANVAAIGCGVSSLGKIRSALYRCIFTNAIFFGARDKLSHARAQNLAPPSCCSLVNDLIHLESPLHNSFKNADQKNSIVVAPCEDLSESRSIDLEQVGILVEAAKRIMPNCEIKIVSHDVRKSMDLFISRRIENYFAQQGIKNLTVASVIIPEVVETYRKASVVITNRMHAAMFGLLSNAAVIILNDGNPKTLAVAEQFSLEVSSVGSISADVALQTLTNAVARVSDIDLQARLTKASELAAVNFVTFSSATG